VAVASTSRWQSASSSGSPIRSPRSIRVLVAVWREALDESLAMIDFGVDEALVSHATHDQSDREVATAR
jgi:hypothetical protein